MIQKLIQEIIYTGVCLAKGWIGAEGFLSFDVI